MPTNHDAFRRAIEEKTVGGKTRAEAMLWASDWFRLQPEREAFIQSLIAAAFPENEPQESEEQSWRLRLQCCGRDDGELRFATGEEADAAREAYTSGPGVAEHGYSSHAGEPGHRRAAIKEYVPNPFPEEAEPQESEETWPCEDCGIQRTKAQGGTIFTVCDGCWAKRRVTNAKAGLPEPNTLRALSPAQAEPKESAERKALEEIVAVGTKLLGGEHIPHPGEYIKAYADVDTIARRALSPAQAEPAEGDR